MPASTAGLADRRARHARSPGPAPHPWTVAARLHDVLTLPDPDDAPSPDSEETLAEDSDGGDDGPPAGPSERPATRRAGQTRWVVLDAFLPGLGHLLAGRRRLGLTFGIPTVIAIGILVGIVVAVPLPRLAAEALNAFALILAIQAAVLALRLIAVVAGLRATWPSPPRRSAAIVAVALVLFVVGPQAYLGYVTNVAREEVDRVFDDQGGGAWVPPPSPSPTPEPASPGTSPSPSPSESPSPEPTPEVARVNVLLIGIDSGVGRRTALTDTMIVASLDPVTETVSMVSIPRDMVDVPLPDGSVYRPKINGLDAYARHNPSRFPGSDGSGHDVLMSAIGTLLDLKIDYWATVNLGGFVRVVDILGGVDVSVSRSLCDPLYDEYGFTKGFSISPGLRHLNGLQALAYARIRKSAGESDFTRAARQQEVISGLRDAVVKRGFISDPVALIKALGQSLGTNVPRAILPELSDPMARVDRTRTYRAVIKSPLVRSGFDGRGSIQIPNIKRIRELSAILFPPTGTLPDASFLAPPPATKGGGSGVGSCAPKATPKPTPAPTPVPSPSELPSGSPDPSASPSGSTAPSPSATASPSQSPTPASPSPAASATP